LRGDDLDEDDLNQLGVKHTIDNEDAAQISWQTLAEFQLKLNQLCCVLTS